MVVRWPHKSTRICTKGVSLFFPIHLVALISHMSSALPQLSGKAEISLISSHIFDPYPPHPHLSSCLFPSPLPLLPSPHPSSPAT